MLYPASPDCSVATKDLGRSTPFPYTTATQSCDYKLCVYVFNVHDMAIMTINGPGGPLWSEGNYLFDIITRSAYCVF